MCTSIPAKEKKKKGRERSGLILGTLHLESKHFGLDPAPSETKRKSH